MKKTLLSLLLIISCSWLSCAKESTRSFDWLKIKPTASFENFEWSVLPDGLSEEMMISLISNPSISSKDPITILPYNQQIIALMPCRLDVLIWSGETWINLYQGNSSGFNCKAHFFFEDSVLYSYGKYGFWHAHSELMYFDFETGYWENSTAKNISINYGGVATFNYDNKLIAMMGQYIHQSSGIDLFEKDGFYFDFKKREWFPLRVEMPNQPLESNWMRPSFDLVDYGVHLFKYQAELGLLVLNKKDFNLYFLRMVFTPLFTAKISFSNENEISFFDEKSNLIFLDIDSEFEKERLQEIGNIKLIENWDSELTSKTPDWENWTFAFFILIILGAVIAIPLMKKRKNTAQSIELESENDSILNSNSNEENVQFINLLLPYSGQSFEVDQFDQIIGLDTIENLDYRRVRRSRVIKSVNAYYLANYGKPILERTKSVQDKRVVLYKILGN